MNKLCDCKGEIVTSIQSVRSISIVYASQFELFTTVVHITTVGQFDHSGAMLPKWCNVTTVVQCYHSVAYSHSGACYHSRSMFTLSTFLNSH